MVAVAAVEMVLYTAVVAVLVLVGRSGIALDCANVLLLPPGHKVLLSAIISFDDFETNKF